MSPKNLENISNFEGCGLILVAYEKNKCINARILEWITTRIVMFSKKNLFYFLIYIYINLNNSHLQHFPLTLIQSICMPFFMERDIQSYCLKSLGSLIETKILYKIFPKILTHFKPMFHFYTPWKCQKTRRFLMFLWGKEIGNWSEMY